MKKVSIGNNSSGHTNRNVISSQNDVKSHAIMKPQRKKEDAKCLLSISIKTIFKVKY